MRRLLKPIIKKTSNTTITIAMRRLSVQLIFEKAFLIFSIMFIAATIVPSKKLEKDDKPDNKKVVVFATTFIKDAEGGT